MSVRSVMYRDGEGSVIDPVCGMSVTPENAAGSFAYSGEQYYFCNTGCLNKFKADPEYFLTRNNQRIAIQPLSVEKSTQTSGPVSAKFICPMHPEVTSSSPGPCSKCGMSLEPRTPAIMKR